MINKNIITYILTGLIIVFSLMLVSCSGTTLRDKEAAQPGSFSFIYMGDSQSDPETGDYEAWGQLLQQAADDETRPSFVMIGGDLVNDGNDQEEWDAFFNAGKPVFDKISLYPAMGNHDNSELYKTIFDLPQNGPEGKEEAFYSFDYGNAHFTVLDSNDMGSADPEDIEWLERDLSDTEKKYKIVMFHHPAYPAVDIPKDMSRAETIREHFVPVMEDAGVDLVLCGHQHVYMRTFPLKNGKRNGEGIVYLMGTSGGKQYNPGSYEYSACSIGNQPVYSIITVNDSGIYIKTKDAEGYVLDSTEPLEITEEQRSLTITVKGDVQNGEKVFTLQEMSAYPDSGFFHIYSTINNWPTFRLYAAKGITVRSILDAAGVLETAQVITFRSDDSYEVSFTREQLLEQQHYYFPEGDEGSDDMKEKVEPIIAFEYKEGSDKMSEIKPDNLCLIIGQRNPSEHTNPAFVENISEIIISEQEPEIWEPASTFPVQGKIAKGETVKLQHKYPGLVKLHYTTDGSDPTELSPIYNPSTYQPELNVPLKITEDTIIKVLVCGYGKENSEISTFAFDTE